MMKQSSLTGYTIVSKSPAAVWVSPARVATRIDAQPFLPDLVELDDLIGSRDDCVLLGSKLDRRRGISGGATPLGANYLTEGIHFIRTENVTPNWIELDEVVFISPADHEQLRRSALQTDDVLLTITGALFGQSATVYSECLPANISQHSVRIAFSSDMNPRFVSTYLNSRYGQAQIHIHKVGATRSAIDYEGVRAIKIPLPPRPVQEYIGAKVRLAERCRLQARELWSDAAHVLSQGSGITLETKYFEQVDEKQVRSTSYQLVSATPMQAWVRQDLVEHELGPQYFHPRRANVILKLRTSGLELKRLTDLTSRRSDRITPERITEVPYYVGLADIDTTTGYFEQKETARGNVLGTSALFKANDILFSKLRPYLNKVAICPAHIPQACGSTELLVYRAHGTTLPYYVFFVLKSNLGLFQILDVTTGSTLPRVDPEIVDDILVPMIARKDQLSIDRNVRTTLHLRHQASLLVSEAKADFEALVEGRLDVDGVMAGRVRPPTWDELEV